MYPIPEVIIIMIFTKAVTVLAYRQPKYVMTPRSGRREGGALIGNPMVKQRLYPFLSTKTCYLRKVPHPRGEHYYRFTNAFDVQKYLLYVDTVRSKTKERGML